MPKSTSFQITCEYGFTLSLEYGSTLNQMSKLSNETMDLFQSKYMSNWSNETMDLFQSKYMKICGSLSTLNKSNNQ